VTTVVETPEKALVQFDGFNILKSNGGVGFVEEAVTQFHRVAENCDLVSYRYQTSTNDNVRNNK
jgi:hypothetical protein